MKTTIQNCSAALVHGVLDKMMKNSDDYVILAIGSDRATGDCVGPLVGHMLTLTNPKLPVFGSLTAPVTALNLEHAHTCLKLRYPTSKIIAIDSCIGARGDIGNIKIDVGGLCPAAAMGKKLRKVGDIAVTAIVAEKPSDLKSVRLSLVYNLATAIATALSALFENDAKNANEAKMA